MSDDDEDISSESTGLLKNNNSSKTKVFRSQRIGQLVHVDSSNDDTFSSDERNANYDEETGPLHNSSRKSQKKKGMKLKYLDGQASEDPTDSDDPNASANEVLARFMAAQQDSEAKLLSSLPPHNQPDNGGNSNFYLRVLLIFFFSLLVAIGAYIELSRMNTVETDRTDDRVILTESNFSISPTFEPTTSSLFIPTYIPSTVTPLVDSDDTPYITNQTIEPTFINITIDDFNTSYTPTFTPTPSSFSNFTSPTNIPTIESSTTTSSSNEGFYSVQHPNILFILADDLGWNSLGYQDYDLAFATPFLTSLAENGIIMNSYYAQEVCTPSRASLLTGRYPLTIGMQYSIIMPTTSWGLNLSETLLPEVLKEEAGYDTYMLGKWHLGHYSPRYLPTARGFDSFVGYLSGENYYWSKKNPDHIEYTDMITSDSECYAPYMDSDLHEYSTFFYRDKAIEIIQKQNSSNPFFLYLAFQAVHDPFTDVQVHGKGVPKEYLRDGVYDSIKQEVVGHKRRQYAMSLSLMDDSVSLIYQALEERGMQNNTYLIFSSDNGGCYVAGGKNGPLRGTKGSLFEGGVRVDSFIYSPTLIPSELKGGIYDGLFHVSDWFPTILNLSSISYTPHTDFSFDGVNQVTGWVTGEPQRKSLLYNAMYNVDGYYFNVQTNGSFAIRNEQYKLMHTYDSPVYGTWWQVEDTLDNDDSLAEGTCNQALAMSGTFTYFLFDLINDPYETVNLYDQVEEEYDNIKTELYAEFATLQSRSSSMTADVESRNLITLPVWNQHSSYIVPWVKKSDLTKWPELPSDCYVSPQPTVSPTMSPSHSYDTKPPTPNPSPSRSPPTNKPSTPSFGPPTPTYTTPTYTTPTHTTPTYTTPTFTSPTIVFPTVVITTPTIFIPPAVTSPTFSGPTPPIPTTHPSPLPTLFPTIAPSEIPTIEPTSEIPTFDPTFDPTAEPTVEPSAEPEPEPEDVDDDNKKNEDDDGGKDEEDDDKDEDTPKPTKKPTFSPTTEENDDWDDDNAGKKNDDDWDDDDDDGKKKVDDDDDWDDDDDGGKKKVDDDDWDDDN